MIKFQYFMHKGHVNK